MTVAKWIWYPGDFEIWLGNKMNNRRTERGAFFPPFWKSDSHYVMVEFSKKLVLDTPEEVAIAVEGTYNIKLDGKLQFGMPAKFTIPAGEHSLCVKVHNQSTPPALYIQGTTVATDETWNVTFEDKEWIDESGKASDTSATLYMNADSWLFDSPDSKPSQFALAREEKEPRLVEHTGSGIIVDFGIETFGYLKLKGITGCGLVHIYYGESREEAQDKEYCETLDKLLVCEDKIVDLVSNESVARTDNYTLSNSKAFRYVYIECTNGMAAGSVAMDYEYLPIGYRGSFRCSDDVINNIWDVSAYTLHVTTREFFIDGIKRDRWVWSGDAVQSYLMNYYLFFDNDSVKRTIWLLRGKDPVTSHVNTILDYTFYWFISISDYYLYSGDRHFVKQIYPRMKTLMDFVLGRVNGDGMVEGLTGDWVFVDWADFPMSKKGALSFEQLLFCKSLDVMARCAELSGNDEDERRYSGLAADLRAKLMPTFWDEERKAFVHNVENGVRSNEVNKFPNMFGIILDYFDDELKKSVLKSVMLNKNIPPTTTPYMRFYELDALCAMGMQEKVTEEIKDYWGGMLREGATTFWEKYNPEESGTQHLSMYGRPYGKSLCHAWGASPLYLLGKYYLGVQPTKPGYEEYVVKPCLGGMHRIEGTVPTPFGSVYVKMEDDKVTVRSDGGRGTLIIGDKRINIPAGETKELRTEN